MKIVRDSSPESSKAERRVKVDSYGRVTISQQEAFDVICEYKNRFKNIYPMVKETI